jgi:putative hydrolase of the HAD superfamily
MLELLKLGHDEVLMVGDWPDRDIQGARNLHIRTALAIYGSDFDTENSGADFLLHSIDELLPILDTLNKGCHPGWSD